MKQHQKLSIPKGQLHFGSEQLLIEDKVNVKLARLLVGLPGLYIFLVLLNNLDGSILRFLTYTIALACIAAGLYLFRHTSDAKAISYAHVEQVKYKQFRFGFKKPVLEILFRNEHKVLKKRYIEVKDEHISTLATELRGKGVEIKM